MRKQTPVVEWKMVENDAEWERLCTPAAPVTQPCRATQRFYVKVIVSILFLAGATLWRWRVDQAAASQSTAELTATVQQELALGAQPADRPPPNDVGSQHGTDALHESPLQETGFVRTANQSAEHPAYLRSETILLQVQGDQAVVKIVTPAQAGNPAYRQTRFYGKTKNGWQPTTANADLWGPMRKLETPSFVFHFRQNDAPAVIAVAPQLEALYTILRQNFGLPLMSATERLVIEVSISQDPGGAGSDWTHPPDRLVVASPARYVAPATMTDADLLLQSLALPLFAQALAQAKERYQIGSTWQPLLDGLYLWQLWDVPLLLSIWRDDVVRWLYLDVPTARVGQPIKLPEHYDALCAAHKLWMPSPVQIRIPLVCVDGNWEAWYGDSWHSTAPLTRLEQFTTTIYSDENLEQASRMTWRYYCLLSLEPIPCEDGGRLGQANSMNWGYYPGQTVALATLIDYATVTYGRERLPELLANLSRSKSWAMLLPAVYGVSAEEFEVGWRAYLASHYGFSLTK